MSKEARTYACRTKAGDSKRGCGGKAKVMSEAETKAWASTLVSGVKKQIKKLEAKVATEVKQLEAVAVEASKEIKQLKAARKVDDRARDKKLVDGKKRSHHKKKA